MMICNPPYILVGHVLKRDNVLLRRHHSGWISAIVFLYQLSTMIFTKKALSGISDSAPAHSLCFNMRAMPCVDDGKINP